MAEKSNGSSGLQVPAVHPVVGRPCDVCGGERASPVHSLCALHFAAWKKSKEIVRFTAAYGSEPIDGQNADRGRVAYEDFVRRLRAETLNALAEPEPNHAA